MSAERFLITGGAGFIGETGLAGNRLPRAARLVNLTVVSLYDSRDFVSKSDADHGCGATLVVADAELVSLMIVSLPVDRDVVLLSETDLAVGALSLVMALVVDTQLACLTIVSLPDKRAAISR